MNNEQSAQHNIKTAEQKLPWNDLKRFFEKHNCTYEEQRKLSELLLALRLGQIDLAMLAMIIKKYEHILYE